jgi:Ras-related C3 botulinum toxin substrate 1
VLLLAMVQSGRPMLLLRYTTNVFPGNHIPTDFDNYSANVTVEDQQINFQLWDTAGQGEYKKLRSLSYPETNVFSLLSPTSLEHMEHMWLPELTN